MFSISTEKFYLMNGLAKYYAIHAWNCGLNHFKRFSLSSLSNDRESHRKAKPKENVINCLFLPFVLEQDAFSMSTTRSRLVESFWMIHKLIFVNGSMCVCLCERACECVYVCICEIVWCIGSFFNRFLCWFTAWHTCRSIRSFHLN